MADIVCLLGVMDRLWFHQVVLFPESSSSHVFVGLKDIEAPQPSSELFRQTSSNAGLSDDSSLLDQETSSQLSASNRAQQEDSNNEEDEQEKEKVGRPTTSRASSSPSNLKKPKRRSQSLSPSLQKGRSSSSHRRSTLAYSSSTEELDQNIISYNNNVVLAGRGRSLYELELEEVKGFMDLGFVFKKENINPKMVSLVPGLQRLGGGEVISTNTDHYQDEETEEGDDAEEEEGSSSIIKRPYLSESWLIRRPDSPLLNLKVLPRNYNAADGTMKKHLRSWARTVASEIQQVY